MNAEIIAVARGRSGNANHHLWNDHGTWWCALTFHLPDHTKCRVRLSLDTHDRPQAPFAGCPAGAVRLPDSLIKLGNRRPALPDFDAKAKG